MCGICGRFNFKTLSPARGETVRKMADSLVHRGPDDEGLHLEGPLAFGFRRLSIIDLSPGGHQPMTIRGSGLWLVFNGEIYNYRELRGELEGAGHRFESSSDTEVILHAYAEWKMGFLDRLNGMFGLALWDGPERRLVVARDRFGIKGVYYSIDEDGLVFASEMRAVLIGLERRPSVDLTAVKLFLKYRYAPSPHTALEGIRKLAAGTCLVIDEGGERLIRWYRKGAGPDGARRDEKELEEELTRLYRNAIRSHLVSDVPVGLLLSGGVDSSLLLALMNECGKGWNTYTVGFGESFSDDELAYAKRTAAFFGSTHKSVLLSRGDFQDLLPEVVSCLEEPITTASIISMYAVCRAAKEGIKVALVGQGPDELWGGYARHLGLRYGGAWRRLPPRVRKLAGGGLRWAAPSETIRRGLDSLGRPDRILRYDEIFSLAPEGEISRLFKDGTAPIEAGEANRECWRDLLGDIGPMDELGGFQLLETRYSLPDELLMYSDKLSMAHSIELRVPYLDRDIVEFAESIPQELKIKGGSRKYLHRKVAAAFVPREIIGRKKRAFASTIVDGWFRDSAEDKFSDYIKDPQSAIYAFLSHAAINSMLAEHRRGARDNHKLLFSVVVLEEWLRSSRNLAPR